MYPVILGRFESGALSQSALSIWRGSALIGYQAANERAALSRSWLPWQPASHPTTAGSEFWSEALGVSFSNFEILKIDLLKFKIPTAWGLSLYFLKS